ncbi:MAG: 30S ribosomal protein S1 [Alphaproteobacteria bacterium]|nr:30S ribosomal protein S1 [Alphaproteobacteria bacterium]
MASIASNLQDRNDDSEFAALLEENFGKDQTIEKSVVNGTVVDIDDEFAIIDVGLKSEGRVSLREFSMPGQAPDVAIGNVVEVFVERVEGRDGLTVLSREKARREEVWADLEKNHEKGEKVTGVIFNRVKGGFTVDLGGAVAFLPGSQVDVRPIKDVSPLMDTPQPFQILKMDRARGNIVVSRRAILEESREEVRNELLENISEGSVLEGVVKNITDYGAFVDLGGVDGLLHVTDISWKRINHPEEVLSVGQTIEVQVIRFNEDTGRISLGMKQLEHDPWEGFEAKYKEGAVFKGKITNVTDYGAFVELEPGIEGLVHVTEMSWTKKNIHPNKIVSVGDEIDVMVLEIDTDKRRISLGIKQTQENPWDSFSDKFKVGDTVEGPINNITEFGMFVGLGEGIDGMVHLSDISWEDQTEDALKDYSQGDTVKVKIMDIDPEKERVALGIKQLEKDPNEGALSGIAKGVVVTGTITDIKATLVHVQVNDQVTGTIKKADLSRERSEQRTDRFAVGEKVDAKVISVDKKSRKLGLSIKAREIDEDKKALEEFGSTESGASLGDILGAALQEKSTDAKSDEKAKKATKKDDK